MAIACNNGLKWNAEAQTTIDRAGFGDQVTWNHRRRPHEDDPLYVRYASCFIAMQMGRRLLKDMDLELDSLDHRNFHQAKQLIEERGEDYFKASRQDINAALKTLYGDQEISVQQLAATFRRGDLIEKLKQIND